MSAGADRQVNQYMDYDVDRTDVRMEDYMNIRDSYDVAVSNFRILF